MLTPKQRTKLTIIKQQLDGILKLLSDMDVKILK